MHTPQQIEALYNTPFIDLIHQAHAQHRSHFNTQDIEKCTLFSIKTGSCPEDCAYCPQSAHHNTQLRKEKLLPLNEVLSQAKRAKESGATRFCMGAAWRNPPKKQLPEVLEMIKGVKALGLETCVTLGMLSEDNALELKAAGLDYYNHNLDTSPDYYEKIIQTRTFQDRLDTLQHVDNAGIHVCCGGIIGMGESREDRIQFLLAIAALPQTPKSIPINRLIPIQGTPLENTPQIDNFEFIKTIAIARILFPTSKLRLSAGRSDMSPEMQAWCFMAGANSIFYGDTLLTANNSEIHADDQLLKNLGLNFNATTP